MREQTILWRDYRSDCRPEDMEQVLVVNAEGDMFFAVFNEGEQDYGVSPYFQPIGLPCVDNVVEWARVKPCH